MFLADIDLRVSRRSTDSWASRTFLAKWQPLTNDRSCAAEVGGHGCSLGYSELPFGRAGIRSPVPAFKFFRFLRAKQLYGRCLDLWTPHFMPVSERYRQISLEIRRIPRWSKPNRAWIPPEYLRERNCSCD